MSHAKAPRSGLGSYVTLGVDREVFAVEVEHVREILDYRQPSQLPNAPPFLIGMIDVRGATIPVVDLRLRLGFPSCEVTPTTRILVLEAEKDGRRLLLGLLTDRVFEVAEIAASDIEAAPEVGVAWNSAYIKGISRVRDSFVVIFDVPRLFSSEEADHLGVPQ